MTSQPTELQRQLSAFFPPEEVHTKPQTVGGQGKALVAFYIDARTVMDRLDSVVGPEGWQDSYEFLPGGMVLCRLSVRVNQTEWLTKQDVGGESEQPDAGDRLKAAVSDALKRAAIKWGIGRYLYSIPKLWHPYDGQKKKFVSTPPIPPRFLPQADPSECITPADVEQLRELLRMTDSREPAFCSFLGVEQLELLPLSGMPRALSALQKKAEKMTRNVPLVEA